MKKRNIYKRALSVILAAMCVVSMTGCGSKDEGSETAKKESAAMQGNADGMVYVPEYVSVNVEYMSNPILIQDKIYYSYGNYNEETEVYTQEIRSITMGETESVTVPITFEETESPNGMCADTEGNLVLLVAKRVNEAEEEYKAVYFIQRYSVDGNLISSIELDTEALSKDKDYFYIQYMEIDSEGNIYISDSESAIWLLDKDGKLTGEVPVTNWINSMFRMPDGKVAVCAWGNEGNMEINVIDFAAKAMGTTYKNIPSMNNGNIKPYGEDKLLLAGSSGAYIYDPATQSATELFNWIDCDINGDNVGGIFTLEDGRILALSRSYDEEKSKMEFVYLTETPASEVTEKTVLTYGALYLDQNVKKSIIDFNKTNSEYRITVKEYYGDAVAAEDYEQVRTQLNSEIVSGNGPDIIDLNNVDVNMYIAKGVLEDLTPFMEADADIKSEDYVQSAFNAYKTDSGMYGVVPGFSVQTVMAKTSDVGSEMGWTIDDVIALLDSKPEGTELFGNETKSSILYFCCNMSIDSFVNWETGECSFDDGYFQKVLEFANKYPLELDYTAMEEEDSTPTKIQDGRLLAQTIYLASAEEYQMYSKMFGEPVTFIGYPTNGKNGTFIRPSSSVGMNSKSANKDGVWAFLKTLLQEEYQSSLSWDFPVLNSALDKVFEEAMTEEYYEDENGEKVPQPKTTWGYDDFEIEIYAATQEEVDIVKNLIDNADGIAANADQEIINIITEEADAYFNGQKDAKSVVDIIQSRVKIYVNENR